MNIMEGVNAQAVNTKLLFQQQNVIKQSIFKKLMMNFMLHLIVLVNLQILLWIEHLWLHIWETNKLTLIMYNSYYKLFRF